LHGRKALKATPLKVSFMAYQIELSTRFLREVTSDENGGIDPDLNCLRLPNKATATSAIESALVPEAVHQGSRISPGQDLSAGNLIAANDNGYQAIYRRAAA